MTVTMTDKPKILLPTQNHIAMLQAMCNVTFHLVKFRKEVNLNIYSAPGLLTVPSCTHVLKLTAQLIEGVNKLQIGLTKMKEEDKQDQSPILNEPSSTNTEGSIGLFLQSAETLNEMLASFKALLLNDMGGEESLILEPPVPTN